MADKIVSAVLPLKLADQVRATAAADERTVSFVIRRIIEAAYENGDAPSESAAAKRSARRKPTHGKS